IILSNLYLHAHFNDLIPGKVEKRSGVVRDAGHKNEHLARHRENLEFSPIASFSRPIKNVVDSLIPCTGLWCLI
ncbi:MAG: hypothetical protein WBV95_20605, partial [Desulfobacterales bacterium]